MLTPQQREFNRFMLYGSIFVCSWLFGGTIDVALKTLGSIALIIWLAQQD